MPSRTQALIAIDVPLSDAPKKAAILTEWLRSLDIIGTEPIEVDELSRITWFNDRAGADSLVHNNRDPFEYRSRGYSLGNGVGIGIGWQSSSPGFCDPELHCPNCTWPHELDLALAYINNFSEQCEPNNMHCHICGFTGSLNAWRISPPFACGHLALHFKDWPMLTDSAAQKLMAQLGGGEVRYICGKW